LSDKGEVSSVLDEALTQMKKITKTDYNQIMLFHPHGDVADELFVVAQYSPCHKQAYRYASRDGLIGHALKVEVKLGSINVPNTKQAAPYLRAVAETQAELIVPLVCNGKILGILNSEAEKPRYYNDNNIQTELGSLASALGGILLDVGWKSTIPEAKVPWIRRGCAELHDGPKGEPGMKTD
jgi:GAF domain-containing protein